MNGFEAIQIATICMTHLDSTHAVSTLRFVDNVYLWSR